MDWVMNGCLALLLSWRRYSGWSTRRGRGSLRVPCGWAHTLDRDFGDVDAAAIISPLLLVELEHFEVFGQEVLYRHIDIRLTRV